MREKNKRQQFGIIAILLFLLLSYPILSAPNKIAYWANIPSLFIYLFIVWALAILILFLTAESKSERKKNE